MASETLTLDQAIFKATQNSPTLQKAEAQAQEGRWRKIEGTILLAPSIELSANHFFVKRYQYLDLEFGGAPVSIPQIFPTSGATVEAKWLLFDGLANLDRYRAADYSKDADEQNFDWTRFQLQEDVTLAYFKVVANKKLKDAADQNLKTIQNHLEQIKKMRSGGIATNYDLLRVEAQVSEAQAEALQAEDNIQISKEKLGQLLGVIDPVSESVDVTGGDLDAPAASKVKDLKFDPNSSKRLDLRSMENRVAASDLQDRSSGKYWVPKISLGGQYIMYNNLTDGITDWDKYRAAWNAGVFLTWDIFQPAEFAKAKVETYKAIQNQKTLQQATVQAPVDFAFWKKRYLYNVTLFDAKKADLTRAEETLRLANAGFKAGVRTTTDVIDAELDLFRARAGIVNAQMNCVEAKTKLELALGEKI
ncbi:MAG: TolC family protein [Bdellovibrionales bacterium]|nr:TolC family protein [Bdellovibrionales bacterium]